MTAGVHDGTAAQAATEAEGNDLVGVGVGIDASSATNGEPPFDDTLATPQASDVPERRPTAEASTGRQVAAILSKPLRRLLARTDSSLQTLGRFFGLGAQAFGYLITDLARLRHPWRDTVNQAWFIISVTAIPALLVSIPFGVIVAVQVGNFIQQVGASSVSGAAGGLGVIRQGAPMVAALLLGGAAGSAVATDLGTRTIREEVDALRVMGVDPVQRLVTPRLAAIVFVAPVLCAFIIFMGLADAVNASVVIGVVAVFVLNLIITQGVSMSMPLRMG